ncbi:polymorphic toxin type 27 domain-containing protein [Streptomyces uncialis]|uniref:polymorphic toxin type 27 domain-containing protein n=1 Tax=Streptomyces uncialis TaxID=1048205 RepID=UPI00386FD17E|nr:polymorphic toxin type 27 domain-containing protein [Streptomyces uncialis]
MALGLRKNGLRGFADGKGYTHYLDSDIWEAEVRSAAHNPTVRLHVSLDGFRGANPGEQFSSAYKNGSGSNWFATEREMCHVGKAVRVGDRSWDSITFYRGGSVVRVPRPGFLSGG